MKKRTKTIDEIFDEGKALDAAARRAVRRALSGSATPRKAAVKRARRRAA